MQVYIKTNIINYVCFYKWSWTTYNRNLCVVLNVCGEEPIILYLLNSVLNLNPIGFSLKWNLGCGWDSLIHSKIDN